jgi:hypothetical protein
MCVEKADKTMFVRKIHTYNVDEIDGRAMLSVKRFKYSIKKRIGLFVLRLLKTYLE